MRPDTLPNYLLSVPTALRRTQEPLFAMGDCKACGGRPNLTGGVVSDTRRRNEPPAPEPSPMISIPRSHSIEQSLPNAQIGLQEGAFGDRTRFDVAPQRNQQFPRERHDPDLPYPLASRTEAALVPLA